MGFLKWVYILGLSIVVVLFIAFGIQAFYREPAPPEYPKDPRFEEPRFAKPIEPTPGPEYFQSPEYQRYLEEQKVFERKFQEFEAARKQYTLNTFYIASVAGIIVIILSLLLPVRLAVIRSGLLLGGVWTIVYAVGRGFGEMNPQARFLVAAIALVALIFLGYRKLRERESTP